MSPLNTSVANLIAPTLPQGLPPVAATAPGPSAFAKLLGQRQAPEPAKPASSGGPNSANKATEANAEARQTHERTTERQRTEQQREARAAESRRAKSEVGDQPDPAGVTEAEEDKADPVLDAALVEFLAARQAPEALADPAAADPALARLLAGTAPAGAASGVADSDHGADAAEPGLADDRTADSAEGAEGGASTSRRGGGLQASRGQQQQRSAEAALRAEGETRPAADPALTAVSEAERPGGIAFAAVQAALAAEPTRREIATEAPSAVGAASATSTRSAASAPPPATVQLPTPAASPEFRAVLGAQISLLARDGVQQAELHLNPAEMGPISVRIALEGQQARVDFGADSAQTRQIIEAGLPELASAMRDAGFTLSGGGVSQHAAGGRQDGGNGAGAGRSGGASPGNDGAVAAEAFDPAARRSQVRQAQGGVDTYA